MDLFTLSAKLVLDTKDFDRDIGAAEKNGSKFGKTLSKIGSVAKTGMKVATAAIGAASGAITKIAKGAVEAYSNYEQLTGGVETLFGTGGRSLEEYQKQIGITNKSTQKQIDKSVKDYKNLVKAQDDVMKNAKQAYRTAGLDMNTYMETVTGFSASLIQSLGGDTVQAASVADRAIIDMSDNANKMGTSIESIQNAYQGFAKQNYTMLDNLKLGYGGTQSEMKRLIKDAAKLKDVQGELGITVDRNSMSFANIVNAISVMQAHLGIAGTTSKEAASTIQGSIGMMTAAWENLKISFADPDGNITESLNTFIESAKTAAENLIPVIGQTLKGIGQAIKEITPVISAELPALFSELLPDIFEGAITLVTGIAQGIVDNLPLIIEAAGKMIDSIITVFKNSDSPVLQFIGDSLAAIKEAVGFVIELFTDFPSAVQKLKDSDSPVLQTVAGGLEAVKAVLDWIVANQEAVVIAVGAIIGAFAISKIITIAASFNPITLAIAGVIAAATFLATHWEEVSAWLSETWETIKSTAVSIWNSLSESATRIWNTISTAVSVAIAVAAEILSGLWEDIKSAATLAWDFLSTTASSVWNTISSAISVAIAVASELLSTLWEGIKTTAEGIWNGLKTTAETVWNAIRDFIRNPIESAKMMLSALWQLIKSGAESVWNGLKATAETTWNAIKDFIHDPISSVQSLLSGIWGTIKQTAEDAWNGIKATASTIWNGIKSFITDPITSAKDTLATIWTTMRTVAQSAWETFKGVIEAAVAPVKAVIDSVASAVQGVIDWFNQLLGFDGKNLASTTSSHTHTETTVKKVVNADGTTSTIATDKEGRESRTDSDGSGGASRGFAKGSVFIPNDMTAMLHRGEMVLTASQARKYRDNESGVDYGTLAQVVAQAVREGMAGVSVNSYLDAELVTESVNRRIGNELVSRRYAT